MPDDRGKIIEMHESEEEQENQDEVIDNSEPESAASESENINEDIPTPTFSHGVTLIANLNGEGIQIVPVQNGQELRVATIDDIFGLLHSANTHLSSNMTMQKIMNELARQKQLALEQAAARKKAELEAKQINDRRSQQRR